LVRGARGWPATSPPGADAGALEADPRRFLQEGLDALVRYVGEGIEST